MPAVRAILLILALCASPQQPEGPRRGGRDGRAPASKEARAQDRERARDAPEPEVEAPPPRVPTREEEEAARRALADAASRALAAVEQRVADAWYARSPSLARRRGLPPLDLQPLSLGVSTRLAWRRAMEGAQGELDSVGAHELELLRAADHAWLERFLAAERALDTLVPEERWDPGLYLEELHGVLTGVARAPELTPDQRLIALTRHLRGVGELLESAREDLADPAPQACALALFDARELEVLLDGDLDRALEAARPTPGRWKAYDEARESAERATAAFREWIAAEAARTKPARTLGAPGWRTLVSGLTGLDAGELDVARLKARLLRDVAELDSALGEGRLPAAPQPDALEPRGVVARVEETLRLGWEEAVRAGVVDGDPPPLRAVVRPAEGAPGALAEVVWGDPPRLVVLAPSPAWTEGARVRRALELSPAAQAAAALRYGLPGEALWEAWARASERVAQRSLWNRVQREGFGLYAAEWAVRGDPVENPLAGDAALAREVARARLIEAVRAYAALELHAGGADEAEVARRIRGLLPIDAASAELEARIALHDPLRGAGYLAYLRLRDAEAELAERLGVESATWAVGRLVRACPSTPADLALEHLPDLGDPPASALADPPAADPEQDVSEPEKDAED